MSAQRTARRARREAARRRTILRRWLARSRAAWCDVRAALDLSFKEYDGRPIEQKNGDANIARADALARRAKKIEASAFARLSWRKRLRAKK